MRKKRALLVAGGTAGHVNPALAIAAELEKQDFEVFFLGSHGIEVDLFSALPNTFFQIEKTAVERRGISIFKNFALPFKLIKNSAKVKQIIKSENIDVVVGFGGYVSAPAYFAANSSKTPIVISEQNVKVGMANKLGAKWAESFAYSFPETKIPASLIKNRATVSLTGVPLIDASNSNSDELDAIVSRLNKNLPTLLIIGGSLGAKSINETIEESADILLDHFNLIHITGKGKSQSANSKNSTMNQTDRGKWLIFEYSNVVRGLINEVDLVIGRSGASTVQEIAIAQKPSILVPLPIGNGEQKLNARLLGKSTIICDDSEFNSNFIKHTILPLFSWNQSQLIAMNEAAKALPKFNAKPDFARLISRVASLSYIRKQKETHFMALSGAGISPIATCFSKFVNVTGCDKLTGGHSENHLENKSALVYSSAIKPGNAEYDLAVKKAETGEIELLHRSDALKLLLDIHKTRIAVAGSHGKTTITAMIASILDLENNNSNALKNSFVIGAEATINCTLTDGGQIATPFLSRKPIISDFDKIVVEADESDSTHTKYETEIAVIPNIEPDHLDFYGTFDDVIVAFLKFAKNSKTVVTTNEVAKLLNLQSIADAGEIQLVIAGELPETVSKDLKVPGEFNRINASLALSASKVAKINEEIAINAIKEFRGAARRFEIHEFAFPNGNKIKVIDDYAHHPTEVQKLLDAAFEKYPDSNIIAVFQPHLFSRTQNFAAEFALQLGRVDHSIVTKIYPARETQEQFPNVSPKTIASINSKIDWNDELIDSVRQSVNKAVELTSNNSKESVILSIGAGDSLINMFEGYIHGNIN